MNDHDARAMERAVSLARRGLGSVEPNPPVGAVLYREGQILAEGFHRAYGELHAERDLLKHIDRVPADATLAVTLEPCSTHGKQPDCVSAILAAGVRRLVVGEVDPNPAHAGQGLEWLRREGVEVLIRQGLVPADLLDPFRRHLVRSRPYVILKWAMTLDGAWALGAGEDRWISGEASRALVHRLRARVDAVVVGSGTVLADDPSLTARPAGPRRLRRVVLDGRGRLPEGARMLATGDPDDVLVVTEAGLVQSAPELRVKNIRDLAGEVLPALRAQSIMSVLVEAGPTLMSAFLAPGLADEAWIFVAPKVSPPSKVRLPELPGGPVLGAVSCQWQQSAEDSWLRLRF